MKNLRFWLLKKLIRNTPVIMNVTINTKGILDIQGAEPEGIFDKWHVNVIEEEKKNAKIKNRNARRKRI